MKKDIILLCFIEFNVDIVGLFILCLGGQIIQCLIIINGHKMSQVIILVHINVQKYSTTLVCQYLKVADEQAHIHSLMYNIYILN